jgi:hypothetical protein
MIPVSMIDEEVRPYFLEAEQTIASDDTYEHEEAGRDPVLLGYILYEKATNDTDLRPAAIERFLESVNGA